MSSAQAIVTNSNKHIGEIEKKKEKEKEKDKNSDNDEEMYEINETLGNNDVSPTAKGNNKECNVENGYDLDDQEEDDEEMYEEIQTMTDGQPL
eukprot:395858_1